MVCARLPLRKDLKVKIDGVIMFAPAVQDHRRLKYSPSWLTSFGINLGRCSNNFLMKNIPLTKPKPVGSSKNLAI